MENEIKDKLMASIKKLLTRDHLLLENDVAERSITHKLAEYLQQIYQDHNVDCEYNRNVVKGDFHPKSIYRVREIVKQKYDKSSSLSIEEFEKVFDEVTTFPDIIVHHRGNNKDNILIIEVKKKYPGIAINSTVDIEKLTAFTNPDGDYKFRAGVFLQLGVKSEFPYVKILAVINGNDPIEIPFT